MFIEDLTPDQQRALLVLARRVVEADDRLTLKEVEAMERRLAVSSFDREPDYHDAGDLELVFDTRAARVRAVLDLMLVGFVDDEFVDDEQNEVYRVATAFGFDDAEWERLRDWAGRYLDLVGEIDTF